MSNRPAGPMLVRRVQRAAHPCVGRDGHAGWWRSQTFADGTRELVLRARLEPIVAGALHARLCELTERGCTRIVLDLTAAGPFDPDELRLLAGALAGQPADTRIALVVPEGFQPTEALGVYADLARSLSQARRLLAAPGSQAQHGPAGSISTAERRALAVRQSLRWAMLAASEGDYDTALSCLATAEAADGGLPAPWQERRRTWARARSEERATG
jgi:hypothetical protein